MGENKRTTIRWNTSAHVSGFERFMESDSFAEEMAAEIMEAFREEKRTLIVDRKRLLRFFEYENVQMIKKKLQTNAPTRVKVIIERGKMGYYNFISVSLFWNQAGFLSKTLKIESFPSN